MFTQNKMEYFDNRLKSSCFHATDAERCDVGDGIGVGRGEGKGRGPGWDLTPICAKSLCVCIHTQPGKVCIRQWKKTHTLLHHHNHTHTPYPTLIDSSKVNMSNLYEWPAQWGEEGRGTPQTAGVNHNWD